MIGETGDIMTLQALTDRDFAQGVTLHPAVSGYLTHTACRGQGCDDDEDCEDGRTWAYWHVPISIGPGECSPGTLLRVQGCGESNEEGEPPGDLYVGLVYADALLRYGSRELIDDANPSPQPAAEDGGDIKIIITLSRQDLRDGTVVPIDYLRGIVCSHCMGTGCDFPGCGRDGFTVNHLTMNVRVPPDRERGGQRGMVFPGFGSEGRYGGKHGDLFVELEEA